MLKKFLAGIAALTMTVSSSYITTTMATDTIITATRGSVTVEASELESRVDINPTNGNVYVYLTSDKADYKSINPNKINVMSLTLKSPNSITLSKEAKTHFSSCTSFSGDDGKLLTITVTKSKDELLFGEDEEGNKAVYLGKIKFTDSQNNNKENYSTISVEYIEYVDTSSNYIVLDSKSRKIEQKDENGNPVKDEDGNIIYETCSNINSKVIIVENDPTVEIKSNETVVVEQTTSNNISTESVTSTKRTRKVTTTTTTTEETTTTTTATEDTTTATTEETTTTTTATEDTTTATIEETTSTATIEETTSTATTEETTTTATTEKATTTTSATEEATTTATTEKATTTSATEEATTTTSATEEATTTSATEEATTTSATEEATTTSVTEKATTTTSATEKAITTATTEEATTTSTEEVTTTTTTMKEREVLTTTTTIANNHIASDEEICNWAVNDYNYKNFDSKKDAVKAVSAEITGKSDNYYEITLKDASGNVLDVYEINPENGIGADTNNVEVNLPQTGNNSLTNILVAFTAFMMTMTGFVSVKFSGIFRRKENE